jgi:hypothetical protein
MDLLPQQWVVSATYYVDINCMYETAPRLNIRLKPRSILTQVVAISFCLSTSSRLQHSPSWFSIMATPIGLVASLSAVAGVVSHLSYFIHGEHMLTAYKLVILALLSPPAVAALLTTVARLSFAHAAQLTFVSYGAYLTALFTSILIYRAFFHPLRHFAGPKLARLSQFYHFFHIRAKVDNYRHLDRLHEKYGEYVRVGPNLLSISDPDMIEVVFHPQSNFAKADCWYPTVLSSATRCDVPESTLLTLRPRRVRYRQPATELGAAAGQGRA